MEDIHDDFDGAWKQALEMYSPAFAERIGYERGEKAGEQKGLLVTIQLWLDVKFGAEGLQLYPAVTQVDDMDRLQDVYTRLITGATLDDLRQLCASHQEN